MQTGIGQPRPSPGRGRTWGRRLVRLAGVYLACWGVTWLAAPSAVTDELASAFAAQRGAGGGQVPVTVRLNAHFAGTGFEFRPVPEPDRPPWACVGTPATPAPFVVTVQFGFLTGPLSAGAGHQTFLWTPWRVYPVRCTWEWIS
jgi:hypothetical protein